MGPHCGKKWWVPYQLYIAAAAGPVWATAGERERMSHTEYVGELNEGNERMWE